MRCQATMPRRTRIVLPDVPMHLIQRRNNRQACFYANGDYLFYLESLQTYARHAGCAVHAYVLMTNHVHLLLTSSTASGAGALMKGLGQRYVQYVNRTYRRNGTLWEGSFRSCLTQEEPYVLGCYPYIELNPVRAGMIEHPGEYRWSSCRANAQGESGSVVSAQERYRALGADEQGRQAAYREIFRYQLDPGLVDEIRKVTNGNFALGSYRFQEQVAKALGCRGVRGQSGRPKKEVDHAKGDLFGSGRS
jgi:putative transposase